MYFVIGFFGALTCLGVFGLGVAAGWKLRNGGASALPAPEGASGGDEQDAFRRLQNYSAEDAYGINQEEDA